MENWEAFNSGKVIPPVDALTAGTSLSTLKLTRSFTVILLASAFARILANLAAEIFTFIELPKSER